MVATEHITDEELLELLTLTVTIDSMGTRAWRNNKGLIHRIYGPAVIYPDGTRAYYRNGRYLRSEKIFVVFA